MADSMMHPEPERLEAYVEGSLPEAERAVVDSHLVACPECQTATEEWRALFTELADLPRPAPGPGFADRVLAGVRIRQPWPARLAAWLERLLPETTKGWAIATAFIALPVLAGGGAMAWLFSRPWISPQGLWLWTRARSFEAFINLTDRAGAVLLENAVALWIGARAQTVLQGAGLPQIGLGLGLLAALVALSAWVVYKNVFRTPSRDVHYASYCF